MSEPLDLMVVGCGPAGASCAGRAAELGLSVLVLERAKFPRSKPCACGLTEGALRLLGADVDLVAHDRSSRLRIEIGRTALVWEAAGPLVTTSTRRELDTRLAHRAEEAGAQILFGAAVSGLSPGEDTVSVGAGGRTIECRYVVGADGPLSTVARLSGEVRQRLCGAAYVRAFPRSLEDLEPHLGTVVFDPTVTRRGYGWIFPKRDHLNVGVYSQLPLGKWLLRDLRRFVESRVPGWDTRGPFAAPIPVSASPRFAARAPSHVGGARSPGSHVLFAGDSAGLADPVTGEGISFAMESGRAAADSVAEALRAGVDAAAIYGSRVRTEIAPRMNTLRRAGNLAYSLGPRGMKTAVAFPPARFLVRRLGSWDRAAEIGGRLSVETTENRRRQQRRA